MSLKNVQLFYERLSNDEAFHTKVHSVSEEEFVQIVKDEGYDFTRQEFEDYTSEILESMDEKELAAVTGGIHGFIGRPFPQLIYGGPRLWWRK